MKLIRGVKSKIKDISRKLFKNKNIEETYLDVNHLSNKLIKCNWCLNKNDRKKLFSKDNYILSLRLYDNTEGKVENNTCIMKEIEIDKSSKECTIKPLASNGNLLIELGFRKPYEKWFLLASSHLKLGSRVANFNDFYIDDSWFYDESNKEETNYIHEKIYQLSRSFASGGSEKIQ